MLQKCSAQNDTLSYKVQQQSLINIILSVTLKFVLKTKLFPGTTAASFSYL
jgi:hypothetical protein